MILCCYARARRVHDTGVARLGSEDDTHQLFAISDDASEVVSGALCAFNAEVTLADGGKQPLIAVEGFRFDERVPMLVFQKAHGLFPSGMSALVNWLDITQAVHDPAPRPEDPIAAVRAMRDDQLSQQPAGFNP